MVIPDASTHIQTPTLRDSDVLADLWVDLARDQRAYNSHLRPEGNRPLVQEALVRHIVMDGVRVARVDDQIVGFVMFSPEQGDYEQNVDRGVIHNLYVTPAHRGSGIGSTLLEAAETELFERGLEAISLEVLAANEAAQRFYARHGYDPHRIELEKSAQNDTHTREDG